MVCTAVASLLTLSACANQATTENPAQTASPPATKTSAKPTPIHSVPPSYPPTAEYEGVQGNVLVCFTVEADGALANLHVEKTKFWPTNEPVIHGNANANKEALRRASKDELKAEAVYTLTQWRFKPGYKDGKPIKTPNTCQMVKYRLSG